MENKKMLVTKEQLSSLFESTREGVIDKYVDPLNAVLEKFEINTPQRIAMFLAQVGHESGGLNVVEENLNYRPGRLAQIFPRYFHDVDAVSYTHLTLPTKLL
jgi:putative chitinase